MLVNLYCFFLGIIVTFISEVISRLQLLLRVIQMAFYSAVTLKCPVVGTGYATSPLSELTDSLTVYYPCLWSATLYATITHLKAICRDVMNKFMTFNFLPSDIIQSVLYLLVFFFGKKK